MMTFRMLLVLSACLAMVVSHDIDAQKWSESLGDVQQRRLNSSNSSSTGNGSEPEPEPETVNKTAGNGSEPEPEPETTKANSTAGNGSGSGTEQSNSSTSSSSDSSTTTVAAEVVMASMEMKMSQADATSVADAFAATATKAKVVTAMKTALAGAMTGVTTAEIEITDIKLSTARLLATAAGTFLRRLNSTNESGTNASTGAGADVSLVVDFEVTAPTGKTGADVIAIAAGMDMSALKTAVETNLKNEADLTVSVTSIATPTASIKADETSGAADDTANANVAGGAFPIAVPVVPQMLLLLVTLFIGA